MRNAATVGMLVARMLFQRQSTKNAGYILVVQAGYTPENVTGELRNYAPDLVLLVDAVEMCDRAGTICWLPMQWIGGMSASTHSLPLSMLAHYLTLKLNCIVALIGIQLESNEVGEITSAMVLEAIREVTDDYYAIKFCVLAYHELTNSLNLLMK